MHRVAPSATAWQLGGRESIFLFSHTNEFCGKSKVAHEPVLAWPWQGDPRRTYKSCRAGSQRQVPGR